MELRPLIWRKKLDRLEHARPLVVPARLLGLVHAVCLGFPAPFEFRLAVLPADPHRFAPARRIRNQPDDLGVATVNAPAALDRPSAQRHRELGAGRIAGTSVVVASGCSVPPAGGELAPMLFAPAPDGRGVATRAVPPARACASAAAAGPAETDERERRRRRESLKIIERSDAHGSCLSRRLSRPCLTR